MVGLSRDGLRHLSRGASNTLSNATSLRARTRNFAHNFIEVLSGASYWLEAARVVVRLQRVLRPFEQPLREVIY